VSVIRRPRQLLQNPRRLPLNRSAAIANDPAVRAAAEELRKRIAPDPLLQAFLGVAALLFLFLVVWAYWE
jgi:hypothetical protein